MLISITDRRFLDSDEVPDPNDMSAFYRESLMSQAAHRFHGSVKKPGAFKMRLECVSLPSSICEAIAYLKDSLMFCSASKRYAAPKRSEEQLEASQWSLGSFVVGRLAFSIWTHLARYYANLKRSDDDEDILYEKDDGLPDDEEALTSESR